MTTTFTLETDELPEGWMWTGDAIVMLRCISDDSSAITYSMRCVGSVKEDMALALGMTTGFADDIRQQWLASLNSEDDDDA